MLKKEIVDSILSYDPDTGFFTRKIKTSSRARAGAVVGVKKNHNRGYIQININGRSYLAHRLAALVMTGEMPLDQIDHKNGVRTDNRWENLRMVSALENAQNRSGAQINSKSQTLGVWRHKGKWVSQIKVGSKRITVGTFECLDDAKQAYKEAKKLFHPGAVL